MKRKRMSASLTVRLSAPLERRLRTRAKRQGKTPSELVRTLIEAEVGHPHDASSLYDRVAHLLERVPNNPSLPHGADARKELEKWNPDRRG